MNPSGRLESGIEAKVNRRGNLHLLSLIKAEQNFIWIAKGKGVPFYLSPNKIFGRVNVFLQGASHLHKCVVDCTEVEAGSRISNLLQKSPATS